MYLRNDVALDAVIHFTKSNVIFFVKNSIKAMLQEIPPLTNVDRVPSAPDHLHTLIMLQDPSPRWQLPFLYLNCLL